MTAVATATREGQALKACPSPILICKCANDGFGNQRKHIILA